MAYRYALIFCCLFIVIKVILAQGELTTAGKVRTLVEEEVAKQNWTLSKVANARSSHYAIAVETSDKYLAFLCIEGRINSIGGLPKDSSLSGILLKRGDATKTITQSRVTFYPDDKSESLFLDSTSFNSNNQGGGFYFWPNTSVSARNERSVIQININGATCQPGHTVLGKFFENHISVTEKDGKLVFSTDVDGKVLANSISLAEQQLKSFSTDAASHTFQALFGDYAFFTARIPPEKDENVAETGLKTGCNYNSIKCIQVSTNNLWEVTPLLDEGAAYSMVAPTREGFVWWEYYASNKQPNGIWVLRMWQRETSTFIILTAIRNVDSQFYLWDKGKWSLTNPADRSLPIVGVVSDGEDCYPSILGNIYSVQMENNVAIP